MGYTEVNQTYTVRIKETYGLGLKHSWIDDYLMVKRSVIKDLQLEWNWIRYHIEGDMFVTILLDDNNHLYLPRFPNTTNVSDRGIRMIQSYVGVGNKMV